MVPSCWRVGPTDGADVGDGLGVAGAWLGVSDGALHGEATTVGLGPLEASTAEAGTGAVGRPAVGLGFELGLAQAASSAASTRPTGPIGSCRPGLAH